MSSRKVFFTFAGFDPDNNVDVFNRSRNDRKTSHSRIHSFSRKKQTDRPMPMNLTIIKTGLLCIYIHIYIIIYIYIHIL